MDPFGDLALLDSPSDETIPSTITKNVIKWTFDLPGTGHSSPVVWDQTVFMTLSSKESPGTRYVMALSLEDGSVKWRNKREHEVYRQHRFNDFSSSTPCCDEKRVYVTWTSPKGVEALALDHNGKELWKIKLEILCKAWKFSLTCFSKKHLSHRKSW